MKPDDKRSAAGDPNAPAPAPPRTRSRGGVTPYKSAETGATGNQAPPFRGRSRNSKGGYPKRPTVAELHADPSNRRQHPPRNIAMLSGALQDVGAARSIVIDETDTILAGGGVVEAATKAGIKKLRIIDADGATLIAVRRSGLTDDQKRRLAMYDNRSAELAEWNPDQLAADLKNGLDLTPYFTDTELAAILQDDGDLAGQRRRLAIARPTEVAWVLIAIPLSDWPAVQETVEQLQQRGVFTTVAVRAAKQAE